MDQSYLMRLAQKVLSGGQEPSAPSSFGAGFSPAAQPQAPQMPSQLGPRTMPQAPLQATQGVIQPGQAMTPGLQQATQALGAPQAPQLGPQQPSPMGGSMPSQQAPRPAPQLGAQQPQYGASLFNPRPSQLSPRPQPQGGMQSIAQGGAPSAMPSDLRFQLMQALSKR